MASRKMKFGAALVLVQAPVLAPIRTKPPLVAIHLKNQPQVGSPKSGREQ